MERDERSPGQDVGGYEVFATLGSGAAGTVYQARDGGGHEVALKVLHPIYGATAEARERLIREARALQKISHPAIARVLDVETDASEPFLVTELIDGPSLEDEVMGGGPLDNEDLVQLAETLAAALEAVHGAGLVHRDIKPSNILVTENGPVLIDFGIAQEVADARMTSHGFVMGTPGYLSPQMLEGDTPDAGTDWWGWAGALVFAATSRAPFGVRPLETVLERVRSGSVDLAGLGPITRAALGGALNPEPEQRMAHEDVLAQLKLAVEAGEEHTVPDPLGSPNAAFPERVAVLGGALAASGASQQQGGGSAPGQEPAGTDGGTKFLPVQANPDDEGGTQAQTAAVPPFPSPSGEPTEHLATGQAGGGHEDTLEFPATNTPQEAGQTAVLPVRTPAPGEGSGDGPGSVPQFASIQEDGGEPEYAPPRYRRRPVALLGLAIPPVLAAGLFPVLTAAVVLLVAIVLRSVALTADALHGRRRQRGVQRSDGIRHTVFFPWYLLRATVGVVPAALVAASVSVIVLGTLWWALQTNRWVPLPKPEGVDTSGVPEQIAVVGTQNVSWAFVAALCLTALVALFVLWFGPLSRKTRRGARTTLGQLAPGAPGAFGVAVVVVALSGLLVWWLILGMPTVWWPFTGPPDLS